MIEVIIKDTKGNMSKMISLSKEAIQKDFVKRCIFKYSVDEMIMEFLQELKEQAKEANKCQKE